VLSNGHAGCGGRVRETDRPKDRHRALVRPYPPGSSRDDAAGGPTVRDAEVRGGNRMVQEANAGKPKGARKPGQDDRVLLRSSRITGRIRDDVPGPEKVLTWTG
jgi:hypothetical protein